MNRRKRWGMRILIIFCLLAFHPVVSAAQQNEQTGVYDLGEIVISGKTTGVEAAQSVYMVTAEEIKNKNARTLDQALNLLPGLNVRIGGEGVPRIDIRGFRTRHVTLLLNGVPMNSAFDQQFDPTKIPTENIAMIKLTEGASSVLYGQGGLGGVINIITKKGTKGAQATISAETGDHEPYLGRATLSGAGGKFDYFISGSTSRTDSFPLSGDYDDTSLQGKGYRLNSDNERTNAFGNVGFNPTESLNLGLTLNYTEGHFGKPSTVYPTSGDIYASNPKYDRVDYLRSASAQLAAEYDFTKQLTVRGWAYINQLSEHDNRYDDANYNSFSKKNSYQQQIRATIQGITVQPRYDMGNAGTITLSASAEKDNWDSGGFLVTNNSGARSSLDAGKSFNLSSLAIQYEISPLKGFGISAGYGHFWQDRDELGQDDYALTLGTYYDLFEGSRLKASFSRNIRFPALGDLYDASQGNATLVAEKSETYETGIEQRLPYDSRMAVNVFYTTLDNFIQVDNLTNKNVNSGLIRLKGFDISATTQCVKKLLLRASYTFLDSEDRTDVGLEQRNYSPRDKVTFEANYDFDFGFTPYLSFVYIGNQYFYSKSAPYQKQKLNDYALINLKFTQKLFKDKLSLYVGADNIFDKNYQTSYGYPQAGRFVYGGIEYRL